MELSVDQAIELAKQAHQAGRIGQAESVYRKILAVHPNHAEALHWLGLVAYHVGKFDDAIALIGRSVASNPNSLEALVSLSNALSAGGRLNESIAVLRKAIDISPDCAIAHYNLGNALFWNQQLDEAVPEYQRAIELNQEPTAAAWGNLGNVLKEKGELDAAMAAYEKAIELQPLDVPNHCNLVHLAYYHPAFTKQMILEGHRRWTKAHAEALAERLPSLNVDRSANRKLRIGYVSPGFKLDPIGRFLLPLFRNHDHGQFEIYAYSDVDRPDAMTEKLKSYCDFWRATGGMPDGALAEQIRDDAIDILIDLSAHTAGNRLLVFARKPAPIQATWLSYPCTTGLPTMDYRLSDVHLDPPGESELLYCEKTLRLPTFWCFAPPEDCPDVAALPAETNGFITFGALNNFCKVNDVALGMWEETLSRVPGSRLIMHARPGSHRERVVERFAKAGIERSRLEFTGSLPLQEYLGLYDRIDIALDTTPFAGGTTTCDALWMGVPVVTVRGKTAVGRGGVSLLNNVGLNEFVAEAPEQFAEIASGLAANIPHLQELRIGMRNRMKGSVLVAENGFARSMEGALREMWAQFVGR